MAGLAQRASRRELPQISRHEAPAAQARTGTPDFATSPTLRRSRAPSRPCAAIARHASRRWAHRTFSTAMRSTISTSATPSRPPPTAPPARKPSRSTASRSRSSSGWCRTASIRCCWSASMWRGTRASRPACSPSRTRCAPRWTLGDSVYDFTIGDHPYKTQFGGEAMPLYETHQGRTLRGRVAAHYHRAAARGQARAQAAAQARKERPGRGTSERRLSCRIVYRCLTTFRCRNGREVNGMAWSLIQTGAGPDLATARSIARFAVPDWASGVPRR